MTALTYSPPRFLLLLSAQSNLLRAALVTRDLKIVASAKQTFQVNDGTFDPLEVWYKMKKVIAACFDIGRTQPRELLACALVSDDDAWCVWQERAGVVSAFGLFWHDALAPAQNALSQASRVLEKNVPILGGTCRTWLLWNLSGAYVLPATNLPEWNARAQACGIPLSPPRVCDLSDENCFGMIRARSPFAEPLPIAAIFSVAELLQADESEISSDVLIQRAAARVDAKFSPESKIQSITSSK